MRDLIEKVKSTANISDEQATQSITTVAQYLKDRMPKTLHSQIDNMLNGEKFSDSLKETFMDAAVEVKEKSQEVFKDVAEKTEEAAKNIKEKVGNLFK
jgi:uncharacterized protein (DUF2267 family)